MSFLSDGGGIFVQQGGTLTIEAGSLSPGTVTGGAGGIFIDGDQAITLAPPSGQTLTISIPIAGATGLSAVVISGGTVVLDATNTYAGATTIESGKLVLGPGGSVAASGAVGLAAGTALVMWAGGNQTIQDLSGVAGSRIALGGNNLTIDEAASTAFAGTIAGSGDLVVEGGGTMILSGENTYSGGTTIAGGTLELTGQSAAGTGAIDFQSSTLAIDSKAALSSNAFVNKVSGFELGDTIDLTGLGFTSGAHLAFQSGQVSVTSGGTTDVLAVGGSHVAADFRLAPAGNGTAIIGTTAKAGSEIALNALIRAFPWLRRAITRSI